MNSTAVMHDVDVFEVGKEQLWRWCGWGGRTNGKMHDSIQCEADTLRKGVWCEVMNAAEYGHMSVVPLLLQSYGSLRAARRAVAECAEDDSRWVGLGGVAFDYEIWHVVDDVELWGDLWRYVDDIPF